MTEPFRQLQAVGSPYRHIRLWLCGCAVSACLAGEARAQGNYDPDWAQHLRIGLLTGFNIKADFRLGGNLPSKPGRFDDGYVIPEPANQSGDHLTSNWGYNDASQFDGASTLTMHQTTSFSPSGSQTSASESAAPYVGFELAYGANFCYLSRMRIGWELGFGFLPIRISDNSSFNANVNRDVFSFDTTAPGAITFPGAPYRGTGGGFSRSINDTPFDQSSDSISDVTVTGSRTLDLALYTFRLGPTFYWDLNQYVGVSLGAGPAVGFITGNYRFNETIGEAASKGRFGVSDVVFGGYINGTVTYHAVRNGDFFFSAQYMPLGTTTFNGMGRQAKLDLQGGIYLSAGINWPF